MNVAIVIDSLAIGGAQKHVRQLACGLAGTGDEVTVWVLNDIVEPLYGDPLQRAGVRVVVVGGRQVASGIGTLRMAARWWAEKVEVVVVCLFVSSIVGRIAAQLAGGVPVLTSLQARNLDYRWWQKALLQLTSGLSGWTISNSQSAIRWAETHEGLCLRRSSYVPNAADPLKPAAPLPTWSELGLPQWEQRYVIGSLGRLHWQKGYDVLLRALALLSPTEKRRLGVVVWGEGKERKALEALRQQLGLDDVVAFPGERADAVDLLGKFQLYIQPSRFEGTPNAVTEALAAGLPVLASAVDGLLDVPPHPRLALLSPELQSEGWARVLQRFVAGEAPRKMLESGAFSDTGPTPLASASSFGRRLGTLVRKNQLSREV